MNGPAPGGVPPAWLVAPFFVLAPLGLAAAGLALVTAPPGTLDAPTTPALIAAVHGIILGWITLTIMGATLQLVPAVLGGQLAPPRPAITALLVAAASLPCLVAAFAGWHLALLEVAAAGMVLAVTLYLVAAARPLRTATVPGPARTALRLAHLFLAATVVLGLIWALALSRGWFPVTPERVAAHALLGLTGWIAIAIAGVTYRLLPMFEISRDAEAHHARAMPPALAAVAVALFGAYLLAAPPALRFVVVVAATLTLAAWLRDAVRLHRHRLRRRPTLYSHATAWSFAWLAAALLVGLLAAAPGTPAARLLIAFGFLALPGWAGATLLANSSRIVPFIAWYHRFAHAAGTTWTPGTADLFPHLLGRASAAAILAVPALGSAAALLDSLALLHLAGACALFGGLLLAGTLAWPFVAPVHPPRAAKAPISTAATR